MDLAICGNFYLTKEGLSGTGAGLYRDLKYVRTDPYPSLGALGKKFQQEIWSFRGKEYSFTIQKQLKAWSISDETFWNQNAIKGQDYLDCAAAIKRYVDPSIKVGCVITPYAQNTFGGTKTFQELVDFATQEDFVAIDPYLLSGAVTASVGVQWSIQFKNACAAKNTDVYLILQGFTLPSIAADSVHAYNKLLINIGGWADIFVGDAFDFPDIPNEWQIDTTYASNGSGINYEPR